MKIYDCFTFNDEVEILKTRIKYLESLVSYFVIAESNRTFSGLEKPFFADKVIQSLGFDLKRFIRVKYVFPDSLLLDFQKNGSRWPLERFARESLSKVIDGLSSTDYVILSDVDEIPSLEQVRKSISLNQLSRVSTPVHYGKLNWKIRGNDPWLTVKIGPADFFSDLNEIRYAVVPVIHVAQTGMHFSDMFKQYEDIKRKAMSSAHSEFDIEEQEFRKVAEYSTQFKTEYRGRFFRKGMGLVDVTTSLNEQQNLLKSFAPEFFDETETPPYYKRVCASYNLTLAWRNRPVVIRETSNFWWFLRAICHHGIWNLNVFLKRIKRRATRLIP